MARPREFSPDSALEAAMDRFWHHGYESTSMADLVECTGVHRGSLYATFGNKEEIFVAALKRFGKKYGLDAMRPLLDAERPVAALKEMIWSRFEEYASGENVCGCMLGNALAVAGPEDGAIFDELREMLELREQFFLQMLSRGQQIGELSADADPQALARYLNTFVLGITLQVRAQPDPDRMREAITAGLAILE